MSNFVIEMTVKAKPETVFDVYTDHRRYAELIKPIRSVELEREGDPAPNGLGAIRKLRLIGATLREEITDYERPGRYSYRMLSGAPVDEYTSTVTFRPSEGRTAIAYHLSVVPSVRMLPVAFLMKRFVRRFMGAAAAEAERREA